MVTAADGAEEFYTKDNNAARRENPEEAVKVDRKLKDWCGRCVCMSTSRVRTPFWGGNGGDRQGNGDSEQPYRGESATIAAIAH